MTKKDKEIKEIIEAKERAEILLNEWTNEGVILPKNKYLKKEFKKMIKNLDKKIKEAENEL